MAVFLIFAGLVFTQIQQTNKARARDVKRISELNVLKTALKMYYMDKKEYPSSTNWCSLESTEGECGIFAEEFAEALKPYLENIPSDPLYPRKEGLKIYSYQYKTIAQNQYYKIHADLETDIEGGFFEVFSESEIPITYEYDHQEEENGEPGQPGEPPKVITLDAEFLGGNDWLFKGEVTAFGSSIFISERGFEWRIEGGSYSGNSWLESGNFGLGAFSTNQSLPEGNSCITYEYRAIAQGNSLWGYGEPPKKVWSCPSVVVYFDPVTYVGSEAPLTGWSVDENLVDILVKLSSPSEEEVQVSWRVIEEQSTAVENQDYIIHNNDRFLVFLPGQTQKFIRVEILEDEEIEGDEIVFFELYNPIKVGLGEQFRAKLTILDDSPNLYFSSETYETQEPRGLFPVAAQIPVKLSKQANEMVTVRWKIIGGTATEGSDYNTSSYAYSNPLVFNPGDTQKLITIFILSDNEIENPETVIFEIYEPNNALIGSPSQAILTIYDKLPGFYFSPANSEVTEPPEGKSISVNFSVKLSESSPTTTKVSWRIKQASTTATYNSDYSISSSIPNPLVFSPGQTQKSISISVHHDNEPEYDEKVVLELRNPIDATLRNPYEATLTIHNRGTHKVLVELATDKNCPTCPSHEYWLSQVYGDFELVSLPCLNGIGYNADIRERLKYVFWNMWPRQFPASSWDLLYKRVVGGQDNVTDLQQAYDDCSFRQVRKIQIISSAYLNSNVISLNVNVKNKENTSYSGSLTVYVVEIISRWDDFNSNPLKNALLGMPIYRQNFSLGPDADQTFQTTWTSPYSGLSKNNILIISSVSSQYPPLDYYYTDQTNSINPQ